MRRELGANGLPDYDGQWLNKPYLLVAQCGSGVASAERGLELVGESGDSLALEVDLAEHFFFGDGVAHAAASARQLHVRPRAHAADPLDQPAQRHDRGRHDRRAQRDRDRARRARRR